MRAQQTTTALVPNSAQIVWVYLHFREQVLRNICKTVNSPLQKRRTKLEPKHNPQLVLGTRRSAIGQFSPLSLVTIPEDFAKVNSTQFPSRSLSNPPLLPYQNHNPVPRLLSYPSLRRENLGTRLPKTLRLKTKPFNRKIRLQFQLQQRFPARKFRAFEFSDLSRMFVFAEISEEEEETFHSLDDIFGILNRSFSLNRKNP